MAGRTRRNLVIVAALAWVLGIAAVGWFLLRDGRLDHLDLTSPRDAAAGFYECLREGDAAGMVACVVAGPSQERLAEALAGATAAGLDAADLTLLPSPDPADLAAAEVVVEGDSARVVFPANDGGVERPTTLHLERDGRTWRVDLLRTTAMTADDATAYAARLATATRQLRRANTATRPGSGAEPRGFD